MRLYFSCSVEGTKLHQRNAFTFLPIAYDENLFPTKKLFERYGDVATTYFSEIYARTSVLPSAIYITTQYFRSGALSQRTIQLHNRFKKIKL